MVFIRAKLSNNPTFTSILLQIHDWSLSAYENSDLPFEMLVDAIETSRDMSSSPIFQVMFALNNAPVPK